MNDSNKLVSIIYDVSEFEEQLAELLLCFPSGISDELIQDLERLLPDIVLGYRTTALRAGGIMEYTIYPRLGKRFEDFLVATARANKISDFPFHLVLRRLSLPEQKIRFSHNRGKMPKEET